MATAQTDLRHSVRFYCEAGVSIIEKYFPLFGEDRFLEPLLALEQAIRNAGHLSSDEMDVVKASMDDLLAVCLAQKTSEEIEQDLVRLDILKAALPEDKVLSRLETAVLREVNTALSDFKYYSKGGVPASQKLLHGHIVARLQNLYEIEEKGEAALRQLPKHREPEPSMYDTL